MNTDDALISLLVMAGIILLVGACRQLAYRGLRRTTNWFNFAQELTATFQICACTRTLPAGRPAPPPTGRPLAHLHFHRPPRLDVSGQRGQPGQQHPTVLQRAAGVRSVVLANRRVSGGRLQLTCA
ncbi:hypothetical protein E2320_005738 [Naja naja]|nr:hypothetical protein E2320_005738 [Naja naja]